MIPIIPKYNHDSKRRRAVFEFLRYMGINVKTEEDVTDRAIFACRLIPTSFLLSAIVVAKLADGYSYNQVSLKLPVSIREIRTTVKRYRSTHKDMIYINHGKEK